MLLRYTYDALDRLTKVTKGLQSVAYTYDGLNRVASRGTSSFAYNGLGLDPVSDGSSLFTRSPSGGLVSQSAAGVSSLVGTNRHGDVTGLFASDGSPRGTRVYDPLGNVAGSSGTGSSLGFQGDFTDATSGGVWMGARWYNPATGVFSVRDSVRGQVSVPGSFNGYGYGWDNPLSMSDPDGHWPAALDNFVGGLVSWGQGVFARVSSVVVGHVMSQVNSALAQVSQFLSKVADLTGIRSMVDDVIRDPGAALQQGARFLVPMAAGVLATGACIGLTGGVGTPVCLALGGAVTGGVAAGMDCQKGSDCVRQVMVGAVAGGVGGLVGGAIGGRVASTLLGRLATGATAGGLGSGAASITGQLLTTGKIDWRQTGDDILNGMAFGALGGALGAKAPRSESLGKTSPIARFEVDSEGVVTDLQTKSGLVARPDRVQLTTTRLQAHVDQAVAEYASGAIRVTWRQARAAKKNPGLEPAFRGQVIDKRVKNLVRRDPSLSHLWVSRSGEVGPDFHDIETDTWWDVTTPEQWAAHVDRYSDAFGWGIGLFTR